MASFGLVSMPSMSSVENSGTPLLTRFLGVFLDDVDTRAFLAINQLTNLRPHIPIAGACQGTPVNRVDRVVL